jgi:hypothetical protein
MAETTDIVGPAWRSDVTTGTTPVRRLPAPTRPTPLSARICGLAPAVAAAALMAYAVRAGVPASHVTRALAVVLATQVLPGLVAWRAVRPRRGWLLEDLAMGFAIGSVLAIGAQSAAGSSGQSWLAYGPLAVAVALLLVPATRARVLSARTEALPWWWGVSVGALSLVAVPQLLGFFRLVPLHWPSGARSAYVDMYHHLALAGQLAHRGPTTFPYVESEPLAYHWFSHAWAAQVSVASGVELDEILFRFMPVLTPVVVVLSIATAAVRLTGRSWTGPVAGLLAMTGGDLNVFGKLSPGLPATPLSPSLGLAAPMLVALVAVLALRWDRSMSPGGVILVPLLALGAAGTKGSTLPLVVAGLALAFVAMLAFNRSEAWRVLGDLVIVTGCLVFAILFIFHGAEGGLSLDPAAAAEQTSASGWLGKPETPSQLALVLAIATVGVLARGIAVFALPFGTNTRRRPLGWLLVGAALAGAGAVALFTHSGAGQWYFARSAIPLIVLGSAVGLAALIDAIRPATRIRVVAVGILAGPVVASLGPLLVRRMEPGAWGRALIMIAIAGAVLAAAGLMGWLADESRTQRLRTAATAMALAVLSAGVVTTWNAVVPARLPGLPVNVPMSYDRATSRGEIDAARWIRDHSGVDDLVMTNRHCTTPVEPVHCDSRRFVVAAFSERQVLLEGWTYTPKSVQLAPEGREAITVNYWHPELLELNDGFIAHPTRDAAQRLRDLGVRWIFVDHTRPYAASLEPYAELRFRAPGVDVYEFAGAGR